MSLCSTIAALILSQSQTGSSLGGSLGSTATATGGSGGDSLKRSTDPLANSHLRNVELGNIGISNEFEEEDEIEESKSESVSALANVYQFCAISSSFKKQFCTCIHCALTTHS